MIEQKETRLHSAIWLCCVVLTLGEWSSLYWVLTAHCAMLVVQDPIVVVAEDSQEKPKPPEDKEALEQAQIKGPVEVPGGEAPKEKQEAAQLDRPGQGKWLSCTSCLDGERLQQPCEGRACVSSFPQPYSRALPFAQPGQLSTAVPLVALTF